MLMLSVTVHEIGFQWKAGRLALLRSNAEDPRRAGDQSWIGIGRRRIIFPQTADDLEGVMDSSRGIRRHEHRIVLAVLHVIAQAHRRVLAKAIPLPVEVALIPGPGQQGAQRSIESRMASPLC